MKKLNYNSKLKIILNYCAMFSLLLLSMISINAYSVSDTAIKNSLFYEAPKGKKLSFDFQNVNLRTLLQLIAKSSGLNFVISDNVKGNVTLKLKDVTWSQALNIIMKSNGLSYRRSSNVVYISTLEDIASNEAKHYQTQEQLTNYAPLVSKIICLKYTSAKNVAELLKSNNGNLLTPRGQIAVDSRTNCVILKDIKSNLGELQRAITKIDIPARQVSIEARIVNIDVTYEEQLGVRFGLSTTGHLSGTLNSANQITGGTTPSSVTNADGLVDPSQRLNFNIPAGQLFNGSNPASIALALARLGPILLDLELSALEGESHAKVISRPRVVTSNQQKAVISTGEEIPYQESTSSGATSVAYKNALLSLEITPQITPDDKINLHIKATQDTRGQSIAVGIDATSGGVTIPIINTQEVESSILLNNNETIVIGGVYRTVKQNTIDRVPFFGSLPVVGHLFRHSGVRDEKHELLIFITPKIIEPLPLKSAKGDTWQYAK